MALGDEACLGDFGGNGGTERGGDSTRSGRGGAWSFKVLGGLSFDVENTCPPFRISMLLKDAEACLGFVGFGIASL